MPIFLSLFLSFQQPYKQSNYLAGVQRSRFTEHENATKCKQTFIIFICLKFLPLCQGHFDLAKRTSQPKALAIEYCLSNMLNFLAKQIVYHVATSKNSFWVYMFLNFFRNIVQRILSFMLVKQCFVSWPNVCLISNSKCLTNNV